MSLKINSKNILALDYGKKRWGLAACDELRIVFALPAITQPTFPERLEAFKKLLVERRIGHLVVGLPLTLEGNKSALTLEVERFIEGFLRPLGLPITTVDEGLSSYAAEASIPKRKVKQGRAVRDGTVDSKAAALLLEEFLSQNPEN